MRLFGLEIELLVVLQAIATILIVGIYSLFSSLQEAAAESRSQSITILLLTFLFEHHPSTQTLLAVSEATEAHVKNSDYVVYWIDKGLARFHETGKLPTVQDINPDRLKELMLAVVLAPLLAFGVTVMLVAEARKYRYYRIVHTEVRRNHMSKGIILLVSNLGFLLLAVAIVSYRASRVGVVLMVLSIAGILTSLALLLLLVRWQQSWRDYWQRQLLEVMSVGARSKDHDLFNRSMMLWAEVWRQPVVPIPGGLGLYVAIFSGVQAVLLGFSEYLKF